MLRDGPWANTPRTIDRATVRKPTPEAFRTAVKDPTIEVIPLIAAQKTRDRPGWCTYTDAFDSPEVEVICGGVNSKAATAAAVWRQGHLLHFGFDLSPDEMSQAGRDLLANCVAYAARFTEDRPIVHAPGRALLRAGADRATSKPAPDKFYVEWYFPSAVRRAGKVEDWAGFQDWYKRHRAYLRADPAAEGALALDEEAMRFGTAPASPEFVPAAVKALKGERAALAATLLHRYAPDGPAGADAGRWESWWKENGPYLFFSESGWYRWYVDPLARKRGVPSASLRGPARASRPAE
ncbi:MAG: hypothetical protein U0871_04510 [Gemmataceae bacterium]